MSIHYTHFPSHEALIQSGIDLLSGHFQLTRDSPYALMLSGGKTPMEIYNRLADQHFPISPFLHLLWSDERMVPGDSPDSNFGNTQRLLSSLGIPDGRLLAVRTQLLLDQAARDFHDQIQNFLDKKGCFPLGLLGLGTDGHTASLFTVEDAREKRGCWAIPVRRSVPPDRVSVTSHLLSKFDRLLILVTGAGKRGILTELKEHPESTPAWWAIKETNRVDVWYWVDEDGSIPSPKYGKVAY